MPMSGHQQVYSDAQDEVLSIYVELALKVSLCLMQDDKMYVL